MMMTQQDLVWGVLVRVPTKSLMPFKCVSKLWYSIICNPKFAIDHSNGRTCFRRSLLFINTCYDVPSLFRKFFYVNLNDNDNCRQFMHHHWTIQEPTFTVFTSVVKGLFGFYTKNLFTLCNIATHEFLELPPSSYDGYRSFYLRFDPVEEAYKVLSICICCDELALQSHIFTLGVNCSDMKWRKTITPIMSLHLYYQHQQCLCINGSLYLVNQRGYDERTLTMFHLNTETFEIIAIPECIELLSGVDLVEISGSPALIFNNGKTLDVWTMNNHCGGGELEMWTRQKVLLPKNPIMKFYIPGMLDYVGILPTGEIMLAESRLGQFPFPIYIYDHLKNNLKSITIDGYGTRLQQVKICYYEESIVSLAFLSSQKQKDQKINSN